MLFNQNFTKLDILASSSSNMTTPTLKTNEHLKNKQTHVFFFILMKIICSHFYFNIQTKLFHILNQHKIYVFNNHFHMFMTVQKVAKKNLIFLLKNTFYETNMML